MIKRIVWVSFGPDVSEEALNFAIYIAQAYGSKLFSLYIKPTTYHEEKIYSLSEDEKVKNTEWSEYTYKQSLKKIEKLQNKIRNENIDFSCNIVEGVPCLEILNYAKEKSADLIVIDKGKNFLDRCIVQKTTLHIIKHSTIPVLSVNQSEEVRGLKTILVPTDKYNLGSEAFKLALDFSDKLNSRIVHLCIFKKSDPAIPVEVKERMHADTYFELCKSEAESNKIESVVIDSENISDGIIEYVNTEDIDLVVLQTFCGEKEKVFHSNGSIAENVVRHVNRPVITIKSNKEEIAREK